MLVSAGNVYLFIGEAIDAALLHVSVVVVILITVIKERRSHRRSVTFMNLRAYRARSFEMAHKSAFRRQHLSKVTSSSSTRATVFKPMPF